MIPLLSFDLYFLGFRLCNFVFCYVGVTATMLQIRLRRDSPPETGNGARPSPTETVTVACPDHLVLADLPVAKGIGSVTPTTVIKPVGRRSRRQLGERVHFCVRCDFPIAIYGRLV